MTYINNKGKNNGGQRKRMHYSPNLLGCINNALDNNKMATLEYEARDYEVSTREVEPMAIIYKNRKRHLVAFCHLRNEYRTFRLDRINLIKVNNSEFKPREGFNVEEFEVDDEFQDWASQNKEDKASE